jgi:hypothetical protein
LTFLQTGANLIAFSLKLNLFDVYLIGRDNGILLLVRLKDIHYSLLLISVAIREKGNIIIIVKYVRGL